MRFLKRLLLAGAFSCVALPALASHAWVNYHWARSVNPFTLMMVNNLTGDWRQYFSQAVKDWNDPSKAAKNNGLNGNVYVPWTGAKVAVASPVTGPGGSACDAVAGTVQLCNGLYGYNGWLGYTVVWFYLSSGHIFQSTVKYNDTYFRLSRYDTPNERQHVVCHEVGHTFGLDHPSTNGTSQNTCLDYFLNVGPYAVSTKSTRPNTHDFEELATIYTHLDAAPSGAVSSAGTSFKSSITVDPSTWGKLTHQSVNGRHSEYIKQEGDGIAAIVQVNWTHETAAVCPTCDHRTHPPGVVKP